MVTIRYGVVSFVNLKYVVQDMVDKNAYSLEEDELNIIANYLQVGGMAYARFACSHPEGLPSVLSTNIFGGGIIPLPHMHSIVVSVDTECDLSLDVACVSNLTLEGKEKYTLDLRKTEKIKRLAIGSTCQSINGGKRLEIDNLEVINISLKNSKDIFKPNIHATNLALEIINEGDLVINSKAQKLSIVSKHLILLDTLTLSLHSSLRDIDIENIFVKEIILECDELLGKVRGIENFLKKGNLGFINNMFLDDLIKNLYKTNTEYEQLVKEGMGYPTFYVSVNYPVDILGAEVVELNGKFYFKYNLRTYHEQKCISSKYYEMILADIC